jgi:hypothetical protein
MSESGSERRRRLINLGELIALGALIVSALGVWISWKGGDDHQPTRVIEQRTPVPLVLRAKRVDDGERLEISPVEDSHALEAATLKLPGGSAIEIGSDGELNADDVQSALKGHDNEAKDQTLSVPVKVSAKYVEAGKDRSANGAYTLRYVWKGGGLFGDRRIRLVGLSKG